jgi:hypothetical protein
MAPLAEYRGPSSDARRQTATLWFSERAVDLARTRTLPSKVLCSARESDRSAILEQVLRDHCDFFPDDMALAVGRREQLSALSRARCGAVLPY